MTTNFQNAPHPLLTSSTVYLVDVPNHIQWKLIETVLKRCGPVLSGPRATREDGHNVLPVHFTQIYHAEMALATLQGVDVPNVSPPLRLVLSHTTELDQTDPQDALYSQFVKLRDPNKPHVLQDATAQEVFRWFRNAGPLASVKVEQDVGYPQKTCVIRYYKEEHARFAQSKCNLIHSVMKITEVFTLRTFMPNHLIIFNLGPSARTGQFKARLVKYGSISAFRLVKEGTNDCHCYVTYNSTDVAARVLRDMNGKTNGPRRLLVRVYEPKEQQQFRAQGSAGNNNDSSSGRSQAGSSAEEPKSTPNAPKSSDSEGSRKADTENQEAQRQKERKARQEEESRRLAEIKIRERKLEEARKKQATATQAFQEHLKKIHQVKSKKDVLLEAEKANRDVNTLLEKGAAAKEALHAKAAKDHNAQSDAWAESLKAVQEAERILAEARVRSKQELENMFSTNREKENSNRASEEARQRLAESKLRGEKLQAQVEEVEQEEKKVKTDGEALQREQQLTEGILKMAELSLEEERDRLKKLRGESPQDAEEARINTKEELAKKAAERKAELAKEAAELKAREDQERRESEARRRQQVYEEAKALEQERCAERDNTFASPSRVWSHAQAISRYRAVSIEFDALEFCATRPLTFGSVPWPALMAPKSATLEQIEWDVVERFFEMLQRSTKRDEYKTLVQEAHRRFHPDRWCSRGLLDTVLDAGERKKLAAAGNIVAQALTPIWMKSRAK